MFNFIRVTEDDVKATAKTGDFPILPALKRKYGEDKKIECGFFFCRVSAADGSEHQEFTYSENLKDTLDCCRGEINYRLMFPAGQYRLFVGQQYVIAPNVPVSALKTLIQRVTGAKNE